MMIQTERLYLIPLTPGQLKLWVRGIPALEEELDCSYRAEPLEGLFLDIVKGQLKKAENDVENYVWFSFWLLVRKIDRTAVGSADFKDSPDANGEIVTE